MDLITNITQKGQVTIPKSIRNLMKLKPRAAVSVSFHKGAAIIKPANSILDLAGMFKPRKNANIDALKAREYMETHYEPV